MAQSAATQRTSYPLAVYNFRVRVGETSMSFTEVSGIGVEYGHVTYRHGLSFQEGEQIQTYVWDAFIPVTCKRGTVLGGEPTYLHDWLRSREARSLEVSLCDGAGSPVLSWRVAAAIPVKLRAPAFSATANDAAIDELELQVRGVSLVKV
jgi:phage tail-like protein